MALNLLLGPPYSVGALDRARWCGWLGLTEALGDSLGPSRPEVDLRPHVDAQAQQQLLGVEGTASRRDLVTR
jgi:hypothetical protein